MRYWLAASLIAVIASAFTPGRAEAQSLKARPKNNIGIAGRIGLTPLPSAGGELFLNFGGRFQLGATYLSGQIDLTKAFEDQEEADGADEDSIGDLVTVDYLKLSNTLALAYARIFFVNSFYVSLGGGQRTLNAKYKLSTTDESASVAEDFKTTSVVSYAAIGNQWTFDSGFVIGIEWVGVVTPSSYDYSVTTETTGVLDDELEETHEDTETFAKEMGKASTSTYALLSLGFAL